ncbi:hypothetical protein ACFLSP_02120 [Bacteroidota bacterium]
MRTCLCRSIMRVILLAMIPCLTIAQETESSTWALNSVDEVKSFGVNVSKVNYKGKESLRVDHKPGEQGEASFAKLVDSDFKDGIIEFELAGKPGENAGQNARGFVGIAFRINKDNSMFECFYLRPTNGRADDQLRRNHSCQYISFPDYPWYKLRQETPGKYESYVDLQPGEWTKVKIEVSGEKAMLYVHGSGQPCLIVNDLKHGPDAQGTIGLWVAVGTEAYFSNLSVTK